MVMLWIGRSQLLKVFESCPCSLTTCSCPQGEGLLEAAELAPIVSHIVVALLALREAAHFARGNRNNCLQLDALGQDILRIFDSDGVPLCITICGAAHAIRTHESNPGDSYTETW